MSTVTITLAQQGGNCAVMQRYSGGYYPGVISVPAVGNINSSEYGFASMMRSDYGLAIPPLSIIMSAVITFVPTNSLSAGVCNAKFRADMELNPAQVINFTDLQNRFTLASTPIAWSNIPISVYDQPVYSPDISSIIQAIIRQPGWVSGNYIAIFFDDMDLLSSAGAWREYKGDYLATSLTITYGFGTITTLPATNISYTQATLNGSLDWIVPGNNADCGFEWGTTTSYGHTTATVNLSSPAVFSQAISGLSLQQYHYRAFATVSGVTTYGSDVTFELDGPNVLLGLNQSIFTPFSSITPTDISPYVMDIKIQRGRMHELNRIEAGTATITVNNTDGRFWRYNTSSPYSPYFVPLTPIQISRAYNNITYPVFTGMIESIQPDWVEDVGGKTSVMKINCVDLLKTLTRFQIYPSTVTGVSFNLTELSSARITRVLNLIASTIPGLSSTWPAGLQNLDTGLVTVSALTDTMITANGMNALQYLQQVADAESGKLFIDVMGRVAFQNRDSAWNTYATSQATFTTGFSGNIYIKPEISDDDTFIYNVSQVNYNGTTTYGYWADTSYVANQGTRLWQNLDGVIYNQADAQDAAYIWTERYKDSILRVKSLALDCDASPADLYPKALGYDLSTRITLQLNNTDNPMALGATGKQYQIMGITHDWQAWKNCWHTTWQLWDLNQYVIIHNIMTNAGDIEVDGVSYATVHTAASGTAFNAGAGNSIGVGQTNAGGAEIIRGLLVLDSSGIPATPPITSASLFLYLDTTGATTLCLVPAGSVTYPVTGTNYHDLLSQTTILGNLALAGGLSNQWVEIPLTAAGIAALNIGGSTTIALRSADDINAVAPTTDELITIPYAVGNAYWAIRFNL